MTKHSNYLSKTIHPCIPSILSKPDIVLWPKWTLEDHLLGWRFMMPGFKCDSYSCFRTLTTLNSPRLKCLQPINSLSLLISQKSKKMSTTIFFKKWHISQSRFGHKYNWKGPNTLCLKIILVLPWRSQYSCVASLWKALPNAKQAPELSVLPKSPPKQANSRLCANIYRLWKSFVKLLPSC